MSAGVRQMQGAHAVPVSAALPTSVYRSNLLAQPEQAAPPRIPSRPAGRPSSAHLSYAASSGGACAASTAMLRGRGCRMPVAAFTAYCCSLSSAAAAADARLAWDCAFCISAWLRLLLRLCPAAAAPNFCSSS